MPIASSWNDLIKAKKKTAIFRIVLTIRGRTVVKEYRDADEYSKWRETYELQRHATNSGIEEIRTEIVYG